MPGAQGTHVGDASCGTDALGGGTGGFHQFVGMSCSSGTSHKAAEEEKNSFRESCLTSSREENAFANVHVVECFIEGRRVVLLEGGRAGLVEGGLREVVERAHLLVGRKTENASRKNKTVTPKRRKSLKEKTQEEIERRAKKGKEKTKEEKRHFGY